VLLSLSCLAWVVALIVAALRRSRAISVALAWRRASTTCRSATEPPSTAAVECGQCGRSTAPQPWDDLGLAGRSQRNRTGPGGRLELPDRAARTVRDLGVLAGLQEEAADLLL
jgi:hypothetical protein